MALRQMSVAQDGWKQLAFWSTYPVRKTYNSSKVYSIVRVSFCSHGHEWDVSCTFFLQAISIYIVGTKLPCAFIATSKSFWLVLYNVSLLFMHFGRFYIIDLYAWYTQFGQMCVCTILS